MQELLSRDPSTLSEEEIRIIDYYNNHYPAIDTPCIMNRICHAIENIDFHIKQRVHTDSEFDYRSLLSDPKFKPVVKISLELKQLIDSRFKEWENLVHAAKNSKARTFEQSTQTFQKDIACQLLREDLSEIVPDPHKLADYLVCLFYEDKKSYSKSTLWALVGKEIYENILSRAPSQFYFPVKDPNGTLEFLYEKYSIQKVNLNKEDDALELAPDNII